MFPIRYSMRFTLGVTIVLMGALALALALTTGEYYRKQALDNQRAALVELTGLAVAERLRDLEERSRDLGLALQSEASFKRVIAGHSPRAIAAELQKQFQQYFVTANIINLDKLVMYGPDYRLIAGATATSAEPGEWSPGCGDAIAHAYPRRGVQRLHTVTGLCTSPRGTRYSVLMPIGGLRPTGYLEVVTDPVPALARVEEKLGFPVRLRDATDQLLFASAEWPAPEAMRSALVGEHVLYTAQKEPVLKVAVMRDVQTLQEKLQGTRYVVTSLAVVVTVVSVLLALFVLEKTTLTPLNNLTAHLRRVSRDKTHLGAPVEIGGIAEIRELADDFNQMASELDRLYSSLEHMAFTDPLTNLPNRARFRDSLDELFETHARAQVPFALFLMDLDRFKQVNDSLGHQIGDLLLQEVSARLRSALRGSDTVARLGSETVIGPNGRMVARLGGDEFAAVLTGVQSNDDASVIARKLLGSMQEVFLIRGHSISIGMSIGIALYPRHGTDIDTLIQRADAAMYFAKNNHTGLAFPDAMRQAELL